MIEELEHKDALPAYREFLSRPEATPFHRPGWLEFLARFFGARIHFLAWYKGDFPAGMMPFLVKRRLFLKAAYSLPLDAPGGALGSPPPPGWHTAFRGFFRVRVADHRGVLSPPWRKALLLQHVVDLSQGLNPSHTRLKEARQASRRGVQISLEEPSPELYGLYLEVKRRRGGFAFPSWAFRELVSAVPSKLWVARVGGEPAAFLLVLYHNSWAYAYTHGFAARFAKARPFTALLLEAMEDAREEGRELFHLGITYPDDEGVRSFKLSFGAEERPYFIYLKKVL